MKKWFMPILFAVVLVLGACGGNDDADNGNTPENDNAQENTENAGNEDSGETVDAGEAEEVYKSNCASCHGQDLGGNSAPNLTSVGSEMDADDIATIIEEGTDGGMPGGLVSGDDVDLLAEWLAEKQ